MEIFPKSPTSDSYLKSVEYFEHLNICIKDKDIAEIFREMNALASIEFQELCEQSKQEYVLRNFIFTDFFQKYAYLCRHLLLLSIWLYNGQENIPKELRKILDERPNYHNPWGKPSKNMSVKEKKH